jgi:ankyrin repeat protein
MGLFTGREVPDPKPRSRTLMDAVRDDDKELIHETLAKGESVTATNAYGRTPLHKACYYSGDRDVIEKLIEFGADVTVVDKGNWTCLHLAARNHHNDALAVLLRAASDDALKIILAVKDVKHGWTAAHSAAIAGNVDGARMLRRAGAAFEMRDNSGASVFDLLIENGIDPEDVV